jgi:type I restriction enzyme, S subunit
MELRPGFRTTDVGVLPSDWEVTMVKEHTAIQTGKRNTQDRKDDGQYPFFVRSETVERIDSHSFEGEAVLTAGDGVGTGKIFHYINGRFDYHQRVYKISDFSPGLDGRFFFLVFSRLFYDRIMSMTAKSSVDSVRLDMIAEMRIPLPCVAEQRAIAAALGDVDALLSALDRLIAKKRDLKQAAMQQLLTGQTRLPGFSGKWSDGHLANVIGALEAGVSVNSVEDDGAAGHDGMYILKTSAVAGGRFVPQECKRIAPRDLGRARLNPKKQTLLVSRMNTPDLVGECGYVDRDYPNLFVPDRLWMTRFKQESDASGLWLSYVLSTPALRRRIGAAATGTSGSMKNLSKQAFLQIPMKFPPGAEQEAIASVLADMDAELTALEQRRDKTRLLKQGMMQELLTGRTRLV